MMPMQRNFFLLIVFNIIDLGTSADKDFKFNLTSAHCYDPEEGVLIDLTQKWFVKSSGDLSSSYCYDRDGMGYKYGSFITSCCNCMTYRCLGGSKYSAGAIQYFVYWYLYRVSSECCQDCEGAVFPPDQVMDVTTMDDECQTKVTSVCKHNDAISRYSGVTIKTYQPFNCCLDSSGLTPAHQTKLDLSSCSIKNCTLGKPSFWIDTPVFPGECNCCEFNGTLVKEGAEVEVSHGLIATCCDGNMVINYTKTRLCAEPKPGCVKSEEECEKCEKYCQEKIDVCEEMEISCTESEDVCDKLPGSPECKAAQEECEENTGKCDKWRAACKKQMESCLVTHCDLTTARKHTLGKETFRKA